MSKISVYFQFKTMYEPGENAPPQFEDEGSTTILLDVVPQYKDKFVFGHTYMVLDVIHSVMNHGSVDISIIATRRVTYPPKTKG